jgi:hypothetical protein
VDCSVCGMHASALGYVIRSLFCTSLFSRTHKMRIYGTCRFVALFFKGYMKIWSSIVWYVILTETVHTLLLFDFVRKFYRCYQQVSMDQSIFCMCMHV